MADKLSRESDLQRKAFEIYYELGDKRSLKTVAETIGRTERTVAGWSRSYNWVSRVTQRNIEEAQNKHGDAVNTQLTDVRTKYRILINNLMANFSKDVTEGKVKIKNVNDYEKLVKLDMLLTNEATDRVEVGGKVDLSQESKDKLDSIIRLMNGLKKS